MNIRNIIKLLLIGVLAYGIWTIFYIPKLTIYKKNYGGKWAFTSDAITLYCFKENNLTLPSFYLHSDGYTFNSSHTDRFKKILLNDENNTSKKMDISIFQTKAKELCD